MIRGIGVDVVDIARMEHILQRRPRFLEKIFSAEERLLFAAREQGAHRRAAMNFAAKEAFAKAVGTGLGAFSLREVEALRTASGMPWLRLSGRAEALAARAGITALHLSLSDEANFAVAFVVAEETE